MKSHFTVQEYLVYPKFLADIVKLMDHRLTGPQVIGIETPSQHSISWLSHTVIRQLDGAFPAFSYRVSPTLSVVCLVPAPRPELPTAPLSVRPSEVCVHSQLGTPIIPRVLVFPNILYFPEDLVHF